MKTIIEIINLVILLPIIFVSTILIILKGIIEDFKTKEKRGK